MNGHRETHESNVVLQTEHRHNQSRTVAVTDIQHITTKPIIRRVYDRSKSWLSVRKQTNMHCAALAGQDLTRERLKITALAEELELPINVHRWRKLETSDPERYSLVIKVRSLQRVLISKSDSVVKKSLLIQEKVSSVKHTCISSLSHTLKPFHQASLL